MKLISGKDEQGVAIVEEEPILPIGVSIEGLRKVFKVGVSRFIEM